MISFACYAVDFLVNIVSEFRVVAAVVNEVRLIFYCVGST